jgi:hypothetical protein
MAPVQQEYDEVVELTFSQPQMMCVMSRAPLILDMAGQGGGKTELIGYLSGQMVNDFPELKGFIGANTDIQLSQSTLTKVFAHWKKYFGFTQYDPKYNLTGHYVVDKIPPPHFVRHEQLKNYYNTICFKNGAMIFVGNLSNYLAHDGKEFGWAHLDETKDTKEEAVSTVILGRLRQYGLWVHPDGSLSYDAHKTQGQALAEELKSWSPLYIHTSPSEGGVPWLIDMFRLGDYEKEIKEQISDPYKYFHKANEKGEIIIYSTFWNEHNLRPGFIQERLAIMSANRALKFIYSYPFSKTGDEYFPHFTRSHNVKPCPYIHGVGVSATFDFNVVPYMTGILAQVVFCSQWLTRSREGVYTRYYTLDEAPEDAEHWEVMQIRFFKEFPLESPDNSTERLCDAIAGELDYLKPVGAPDQDVLVYGDATGRNRIVGMGELSQYRIIEGKLARFLPGQMDTWLRAPYANLMNMKRRDVLNRIFEGKVPDVEVLVDPSCQKLINDLENVKQRGDGGKDPEKEKGVETMGHMSDAAEYLICPLCKDLLKDFS